MTRKRWLTLGGIVFIALILAFPLQDVIRKTVIVPLAYVWWALGVLYQSFPQVVIWILLVIWITFMLFGSLTSKRKRIPRDDRKLKPARGRVEELSESLVKIPRGTYYKWQVANRLGRLARDFLVLRGDRSDTRDHRPLTGRDWHPPEPIDAYLDTGLRGSFADFPNQGWSFKRPEPTPLDVDVEEVVKFLEIQIRTQ